MIEAVYYTSLNFSTMKLLIASSSKGLLLIEFNKEQEEFVELLKDHFPSLEPIKDREKNLQYINQLTEYFQGKRKEFTFPISLTGTAFQTKVWKELANIPYGKTASYRDIAERIDNPKAMRAVGMANNKNKLPIVIPCHRVIGVNNRLIGYGGGLHIKEELLKLEGINVKDDKVI
ncbi:methylated-DNA--[protein]-cysteine S-methyltransferase [Alkaliphilus pronyensis]|uniref:Methylated-DNA--protein-cysteine methyltransferase n=1 Tax=Alkaliphilus pronyensis TaxID=1482732 RepID=A0A6I0FDW1_9FIRM|nr:methylated-DNA--[protein]-cysteine S-methyltransferase [Alkaliphilus pronyensis]KAB3532891.1 methylated-DNA--[protein]-cysteine S-methyltransferase [Alkaliphilus pronyensis]